VERLYWHPLSYFQ